MIKIGLAIILALTAVLFIWMVFITVKDWLEEHNAWPKEKITGGFKSR